MDGGADSARERQDGPDCASARGIYTYVPFLYFLALFLACAQHRWDQRLVFAALPSIVLSFSFSDTIISVSDIHASSPRSGSRKQHRSDRLRLGQQTPLDPPQLKTRTYIQGTALQLFPPTVTLSQCSGYVRSYRMAFLGSLALHNMCNVSKSCTIIL